MNLDWLQPELRTLVEKMTDAQVVSLVLFGEARSEPVQGIVAVGSVIRNRVKADLGKDGKPDWWGEGFPGVCLAKLQFSCLIPAGGKENYSRVLGFAQKLAAGTPITEANERQCVWVAHGIVGDYAADNTKGSMHYHTAAMVPRPTWAQKVEPTVQVGRHVFYATVT